MKLKDVKIEISNKIDSYFLNKSNENSLCINGTWGSGKTTLLKELSKYNVNEFLFFNLWKYEIYSENFSSLFFIELLNTFESKSNLKKISFNILKSLINWALNKSFGIKIEQIKKDFEYENNEIKKIYNNFIETRDLKVLFNEIFNELDKKFVIIFDDLDRCCDTTIIKLISSIKNILFETESKNIFYITALNKSHINEILGNKKENYTDKIFDITMDLNDFLEFDNYVFPSGNKLTSDWIIETGIVNFRIVERVFKKVRLNYEPKNDEEGFLFFWKTYIEETNPGLFNFFLKNINEKDSEKINNLVKNIESSIKYENSKFSLEELKYELDYDNSVNLRTFSKWNLSYNPILITFIYKNLKLPFSVVYPFVKDFKNFSSSKIKFEFNPSISYEPLGKQLIIYLDIFENQENFFYDEFVKILFIYSYNENFELLISIFNNWKRSLFK